jgi:hypothetical protein
LPLAYLPWDARPVRARVVSELKILIAGCRIGAGAALFGDVRSRRELQLGAAVSETREPRYNVREPIIGETRYVQC